MNFRESKLYSVLNNRCPHCHEGKYFTTDNFYDLKNFGKMNKKCSVCSEDFIREPGYYFGATYVSYALTVAFGIGLFLLLEVLAGMGTVSFLITFSLLLIALLPVFYRLARLIWINMFVSFRSTEYKVQRTEKPGRDIRC